MKRKIIQIATLQEGDTQFAVTIALCDDSTLWFSRGGLAWTQYPEIPDAPDLRPHATPQSYGTES